MEKQTRELAPRRNRLAAKFPNLQELNKDLPETNAINSDSSTMASSRKFPQRNILPAGAEGERTFSGTKFYMDSKEPEPNGTIIFKKCSNYWSELRILSVTST